MLPRTLSMIKAVIILPGTAAVFVPTALVLLEGGLRINAPGHGAFGLGALIVSIGLLVAVHTAGLFLTVGEGTPAPWDPPRRLVVRGLYRHVRNPMIMGVICILVGEALALGSWYVLGWAGVFFAVNNFYFIYFEEPGLLRRHGSAYADYKGKVPRWLPRLRPYESTGPGGPAGPDISGGN